MKRFTKAAIAALGAALVSQAAQAANTDLVLGFTGNSASSDAVIDLGSAATVGVGGSSVVDLIDTTPGASETGLSGANFQTLLSSVFSGGVNGASMTVAAGAGGTSPFFYATEDRGSAGSPTAPISSAPFAWTKNQEASVGAFPAGVLNGASISFQGGNAAVPLSSGGSPNAQAFSYLILGVNNPGTSIASFLNLPNSTVAGGKAYEDLWFNSKGTGWVYEGYFALDLTGDTTELLTFNPASVSVPEPATYGLFAGFGLLLVAIRRQFRGFAA